MNAATPDYLARHKARLIELRSGTRLLVDNNNVIFVNLDPESLRSIVNEAVDVAVRYFQANLQSSVEKIEVTDVQVEEVAIQVALANLYVFNMWKNNNEGEQDRELVLTLDDLDHHSAHDEVLFYCEETFPKNYQAVAASLLGTTREEFARWETERRDFWERR